MLLSTLSLAACKSAPIQEAVANPITTGNMSSQFSDWFQVYFSNPNTPDAETLRGGPDQALADAIRQARLSVDVAVYDLDLWSIRDALLDAHRRGVDVKMVTDSDNLGEQEIMEIKEAGIPVLGDRREGLMHNKFIVIDNQEIWTGSMNLTINSAYRNNDNLIHIHSAELAGNYTTEFNEMFIDDRFGPGSPFNTPSPISTVNGSQVEVYFSPEDRVEAHILQIIQSAKKNIKFMAYSFTSDQIAEAMLARHEQGVAVSGVFEEEQVHSNQGTEYDRLKTAGIDVRLDGNPQNMHHKVIIIDDQIVLTGSYNFSNNAKNFNDENLLILYNPDIAAAYSTEFDKVYNQAQP